MEYWTIKENKKKTSELLKEHKQLKEDLEASNPKTECLDCGREDCFAEPGEKCHQSPDKCEHKHIESNMQEKLLAEAEVALKEQEVREEGMF